ncbi:hypothetical protein D3C81_943700 [compost metagenome]
MGSFIQLVMEGDIEQVDLIIDRIQEFLTGLQFILPELPDDIEVFSALLLHSRCELTDKVMVNMLDRIKPITAALQRIHEPLPPFQHLLTYIRMAVIDVREHQIVIVAEFVIYVLGPLLVLGMNTEDAGTAFLIVIIRSVEMLPVPFEGGVVISTAREGEFGPALNFERLGNLLGPVIRIDFNYFKALGLIRTRLMVHDQVDIDQNSILLAGCNSLDQFILCSVFGAHASLLVEFTQVI